MDRFLVLGDVWEEGASCPVLLMEVEVALHAWLGEELPHDCPKAGGDRPGRPQQLRFPTAASYQLQTQSLPAPDIHYMLSMSPAIAFIFDCQCGCNCAVSANTAG